MRKIRVIIGSVLTALVMWGCSERVRPDLYEEIRRADKMVFASMVVTKTVKTENSDWYKYGKRIAVYSYDNYLHAYIDLSTLSQDDIAFDNRTETVRVTLPPVQIETEGRDMDMRLEYVNVGLFRSGIDAKERAELKERANESFRAEVEENTELRRRLTDSAEAKARSYFEALIEAQGYKAEINFKR